MKVVRAASCCALALALCLGHVVVAGAESVAPRDLIAQVDVEQHLGADLPLDARFVDDEGRDVALGDFFGKRPVVMALVYYECPMLCTVVLNGLVRALRTLDLTAGRDFEVVVASFDPGEGPDLAGAKKRRYVDAYDRDGAAEGWHFLTASPASIARLTDTLGFRYVYDPESDEYAHAAAIFVITPEGKIARYLFGVEYAPRDVRLALVEASGGKVGSLTDRLLLLCYHYDPSTGRYTRVALGALRVGGVLTILAIGGLIFALGRRKRGGGAPV